MNTAEELDDKGEIFYVDKAYNKMFVQEAEIPYLLPSAKGRIHHMISSKFADSEDEQREDDLNGTLKWNVNDVPVNLKLLQISEQVRLGQEYHALINDFKPNDNHRRNVPQTDTYLNHFNEVQRKRDATLTRSTTSLQNKDEKFSSAKQINIDPDIRKKNYEAWLRKKNKTFAINKQIAEEKKLLEKERKRKQEEELNELRKESFKRWLNKKNESKKEEKMLRSLLGANERPEDMGEMVEGLSAETKMRQWTSRKQDPMRKEKERQNKVNLRTEELNSLKKRERTLENNMKASRKKSAPALTTTTAKRKEGFKNSGTSPVPSNIIKKPNRTIETNRICDETFI